MIKDLQWFHTLFYSKSETEALDWYMENLVYAKKEPFQPDREKEVEHDVETVDVEDISESEVLTVELA
jgi:hypothetical protein